jgi:hypothetical protein
MTHRTSTQRTRKLCASALAALGVALAGATLSASPAQARNEFENGFEDQMGRLLAVEAFHVGRVILGGGYPWPAYYGGWGHPGWGPPRHYRSKPVYRHRGHGRDCDDVEYRYEVRRDRYGKLVKESYRSRGDDRRDGRGYWRY